MEISVNVDSLRQREHSVAQSFLAMLTILEVVEHTLAPGYVSPDANCRGNNCNIVPLDGTDTNYVGKECSSV